MTDFDLEKYGKLFGTGLMQQALPGVVKGLLFRVLCNVSVPQAVEWVRCDKKLWEEIPCNYREKILANAQYLGHMKWFTSEWVIESQKEKLPGLASLFLNWPVSQAWLAKQVEEIKSEVVNARTTDTAITARPIAPAGTQVPTQV